MLVFQGVCTVACKFHLILRHPSLGLRKSSLTLWYRVQPFHSRRCLFFRVLHLSIQFWFHPVSSLFGTQQQFTHPPAKSSTLPHRKMPIFQGVAPWHTIFTSSSAFLFGTQQHLTPPPVKRWTLPFRKMVLFQDVAPWRTNFHFILRLPSLELSNSSLTLR